MSKKKKDVLMQELRDRKYEAFPRVLAKGAKKEEEDEDEQDEDEDQVESQTSSDYDYLLSVSHRRHI